MQKEKELLSFKQWLLILFISLFWWLVLLARGSSHATVSAKWSDNVSNISTSWIFLHEGFKIYGQPISHFTEDGTLRDRLSPQWTLDLQDSQGEFFKSKYKVGQADYLVWSAAPRPYPLGSFLLFMPWAFLTYGFDLGYLIPVWSMAYFFLVLAHLGFFYWALRVRLKR